MGTVNRAVDVALYRVQNKFQSESNLFMNKVDFKPRAQNLPLYSWDPQWDYQYTDVFPALSNDGKLVYTEKHRNSSVVISDSDGSNRKLVFEMSTSGLDSTQASRGLAGAFQPAWSPDGHWIVFGLGQWFQERRHGTAKIMRVRRDGTGLEELTGFVIPAGQTCSARSAVPSRSSAATA